MRVHLSSNLSRRLEVLTRSKHGADSEKRYRLATILGPQILAEEDMSELTVWQRTVLSWPQVLSADAWEREALDSQERLVRETGDWLATPVANINSPEPSGEPRHSEPFLDNQKRAQRLA